MREPFAVELAIAELLMIRDGSEASQQLVDVMSP